MPRWFTRLALPAVFLFTLTLSAPASAGTISVTTTVDQRDGAAPCSLREAVDTANADANLGGCADANPAAADTIKLDGGDYNLRRAGAEDANASGDLDVTESLAIAGAGADVTGIDGNGAITGDRVLQISSGTLTISALTVHDGRAGAGGGISAEAGTTLKLTNGTVSGNETFNSGGGIFGDTVTLTNSTVRNNSGTVVGGGIFARGTATLTGSTVSGNTVLGMEVGGGGIYANTAKLTNSTVTANRASAVEPTSSPRAFGGGIFATTANLTDSTVSGNEATVDSGPGPPAGPSIGGGISGPSATLTRSTVSDNTAGTDGGGIFATTANLTDSTVSDNSAGAGGGGIFGAGTLTDSSVRRNTSGAEGGGIYSRDGSLTVTRSTVSDNDATNNAGGIFYTSPGTLSVTNSTLSGNESNAWGGALSTDEGTTILKNATVNRNVADADDAGFAGDGGGLDQFGTATVNLRNTILAGNVDRGSSFPEYPDWNCSGGIVSQGYNLISSTAGCAVAPASGDQTAADPGLAFLASNGGKTLTQVLLPTSPALNAGNPAAPGSGASACPATDQRGVPRTLGGRCDAGAYERASCRGKLVNLVGTGGADVLVGTSAADGILGLGGSDVVSGGSGGDGLCGQDGNDQLFGEVGADFLDGGGGSDTCVGGTETDQAVGCETISSIP